MRRSLLFLLTLWGLLLPTGAGGQEYVRLATNQVSGTLDAADDTITLGTASLASVSVQTLDSYTGTWELQCSLDGSTFDADDEIPMTLIGATSQVSSVSDTVGVWQANIAGCLQVRVYATAWTAGDVAVVIRAITSGGGSSGGGGGGAVSITQGGNTAEVNASSQLSVVCANCSGSGVSVLEDAASADGAAGTPAYAVRQDTIGATTSTDGDYQPLKSTSTGRLYTSTTVDAAIPAGTNNIGDVDVLSIAAGNNNIGDVDVASIAAGDNNIGNVDIVSGTVTTVSTVTTLSQLGGTAVPIEDAPETMSGTGLYALTVRRDTAASSAGTTGDNATINTDATGLLWVRIGASDVASGGTALADDADFTAGTTNFTPMGGFYQSTVTACTDGDTCAAGITAQRTLKTTLFSAAGAELTPATDATHDSAVSATGPVAVLEAKDFDGAALPNTVSAEGDAVRQAATLAGVSYVMLVSEDGSLERGTSTTPLVVGDGSGALNVIVDSGTIGTVTTLSQFAGNAINLGTGTIGTGTLRIAIATDDPVNDAAVETSNAIFADDGAFTLTSSSVMVAGAIRDDSLGTLTAIEGDAVPLRVSSTGALHVTGGGGGTEFAEDSPHSSQALGSLPLAVRNDAGTALAQDGDYIPLMVNSAGALYVTGGGGGTEYVVNAVTPADPTGTTLVMERDDALSAVTEIEGDWTNARANANGALWVVVDGTTTVSGTVTANLAAGTNNIGDVDVLTVPAPLSTTGGGTEATALRVTLANDSTGVVSVDDNGGALTVDGTVTVTDGAGALNVIIDSSATLTVTDGAGALNTIIDSGTVTTVSTVTTLSQLGGVALPVEDVGETAAGVGIYAMGVRRDTAASSAGTTGDNATINTDALGQIWSRFLDPCSGVAKQYIPINISTATTTELTASLAGASTHYYVCGLNLVTAAANNVALVDDDSDGCGSVTSGLAGGTSAASGWNFAANGGMTLGSGVSSVMRTGGTNRVLCMVTSAATQLSGHIVVVAAP